MQLKKNFELKNFWTLPVLINCTHHFDEEGFSAFLFGWYLSRYNIKRDKPCKKNQVNSSQKPLYRHPQEP